MPDGGVLFEGDMILPRSMFKQLIEEGTMVKNEERIKGMKWTDGIVPYVVHKDLSKFIWSYIFLIIFDKLQRNIGETE